MGFSERIGKFLHETIFYQDDLKIRARVSIDEIAQHTQQDIDLGLLNAKELQALETDSEFERTYQRLWKVMNTPEFEFILGSMTIAKRDAIGLRHAEYLRRRWFPKDPPITLDFTGEPKLAPENHPVR